MIFLNIDIVEERYRVKTKLRKQPCNGKSVFQFGWNSLAKTHESQPLPLEDAIIRAHIEAIPRLLNERGKATVKVDAYIKILGRNGSSIFSSTKDLAVTSTFEDWVEMNITEGLIQLWPPTTTDRGVEVTLFLSTDCSLSRKLPAQFTNPATIPLSQSNRRKRLLSKQPFLVVSLSDETIKEIVKSQSSNEEAEAQEDIVAVQSSRNGNGTRNTGNARRKRSTDGCHREDFSVNFAQIGIGYITSPISYNAMQCKGSCNHDFLTINSNLGNNHARIMAGSRAAYELEQRSSTGLRFSTVPKEPCCVPTKYDALPVLEIDTDHSIKYNVYPSMIVKECGCR